MASIDPWEVYAAGEMNSERTSLWSPPAELVRRRNRVLVVGFFRRRHGAVRVQTGASAESWKIIYLDLEIRDHDIICSLVGARSESEKCDHPPVIHTPDEVALSKKKLLTRSFCENFPESVIASMETL